MFDDRPTAYDLSFRFLGFPVRIHPFFWVLVVFLGIGGKIDHLAIWFLQLAVWVAAVLVSILVHELGHALVFRHVFGVPSYIVLHALGGVTIPVRPPPRRHGLGGVLRQVLLSASGVLLQFLLAGILLAVLVAMFSSFAAFAQALDSERAGARGLVVLWMYYTIVVSIVWGIFNLLPIYPMDGGHISREIFSFFSPRRGVANSLVLSIVVAVLCAVLSLRTGRPFLPILLGYFAYQNYVELVRGSFRLR